MSIILAAIMMCTAFVSSVWAAEATISNDSLQNAMQTEIDKEIKIAHDEIYRQLEAQDALVLLPVYEELIYTQIEEQISSEYGISPSTSRVSYHAPNGGMVTYLSPISGAQPTEVAVVCLNESDSYDFLLENYSFNLRNVLSTVIGYIPNLGSVTGIILDIAGICDSLAVTSIKNAGRCAKVVNTYSREYGTKASVVTGWTDRFNIIIPDNAGVSQSLCKPSN